MNAEIPARLTLFFAGIIGAAGVILSALAAHGGDTRLLGTASVVCMSQAPALLALHAGFKMIRTAIPASLLIGLGCILFAGDLVFRSRYGSGLFPMSAPTGGTMMILGWVAIAIGAFFKHPA